MPLYFAYGSNMNVAAMATRCPKAAALGPARLARHKFFIMEQGYASVSRDSARAVHGLLWDVPLSDMRALDAYEDVASGLYVKVQQGVVPAGGAAKRALVYVGSSVRPGRPRPGYMEEVMAAAEAAGLPAAYLRELSAFAPAQRARPLVAPSPAGPVAGVRPRFASPVDPERAP